MYSKRKRHEHASILQNEIKNIEVFLFVVQLKWRNKCALIGAKREKVKSSTNEILLLLRCCCRLSCSFRFYSPNIFTTFFFIFSHSVHCRLNETRKILFGFYWACDFWKIKKKTRRKQWISHWMNLVLFFTDAGRNALHYSCIVRLRRCRAAKVLLVWRNYNEIVRF